MKFSVILFNPDIQILNDILYLDALFLIIDRYEILKIFKNFEIWLRWFGTSNKLFKILANIIAFSGNSNNRYYKIILTLAITYQCLKYVLFY